MCFRIRLFLFIVFFFGVYQSGFAVPLLVHKTVYFDIIYAPESEKTAALIAEKADSYAAEIAEKLHKKILVRMPVYIASNRQHLNGSFSFFPYPKIILFDTVPEDGILAGFTDTILKVFYHELTHALSLIYFLPVLPMSFNEGAAVSYESLEENQGRLHDPYVQHFLMQGKIDGTSPSWQESSGLRDVYPRGLWPYIYGGAFAAYLQQTYGMETYARYWHSDTALFPNSKTKKVFGIPLRTLWQRFIDSIPVPSNYSLPVSFVDRQSGFLYTAAARSGIACFDGISREVCLYTPDGKAEKLFTANPTLTHLSFSQDGSQLLVSDIIQTLKGETYRTQVFSVKTKHFSKDVVYNLRAAAFCGEGKLCGITTDEQFVHLVTAPLESPEQRSVLFSAGPGLAYTALYNPVFAGEHTIACIAANGIERDILLIDTETKEIKKIVSAQTLPAIRYLQTNNEADVPILTFSWAGKDMLYRAAYYNLKTKELSVLDEDISGGVFFPVIIPDRNEQAAAASDSDSSGDTPVFQEPFRLAYIGMHGTYNALYMLESSRFHPVQQPTSTVPEVHTLSIPPKLDMLRSKKYCGFSWVWRVFPLLYVIPPADLTDWNKTALALDLYGGDPSETVSFKLSSLFYFKPFFYQPHVQVTVQHHPFSFSLSVYDINNYFRYRTVGTTAYFSLSIPSEHIYQNTMLSAGVSAEGFAFFTEGYRTKPNLYGYALSNTVLSDMLECSYTFLQPDTALGTRFFTKKTKGVSLKAGIKHGFHVETGSHAIVMQTAASLYMPVVPLRFDISGYAGYHAQYTPAGGFVFFGNPALLGMASYLPSMPEHVQDSPPYKHGSGAFHTGLGVDAELTFFSYDIQTGSSWLPIFYNRVKMSIGYKNAVTFFDLRTQVPHCILYQSVYAAMRFTISGTAQVGCMYAQPLENRFGRLNLLLHITL